MRKISIGNRIKQARLLKGITQKQLAEKVGISDSAITLYEKELREPSLEMIKKLANNLGVTSSWLAFGESKQVEIVIQLENNKSNNEIIEAMNEKIKVALMLDDEKSFDKWFSVLKEHHEILKERRMYECTK